MSDTATMTVVDWLRACLAEDEAAAKAASPGGWQYSTVESVGGGALYDETRTIGNMVYEQPDDHDGRIIRHLLEPETDANGEHVARHDPAAVLADIAAKRRILDEYTESASRTAAHGAPSNAEVRTAALADVIQILAEAYADRPGWREEWQR